MSFRPMSSTVLATCLAILAALVFVACGSEPTPAPPAATLVPLPTATTAPTPTPVPSPTPTPNVAPTRGTLLPEGATLAVDARVADILSAGMFATVLEAMLLVDESGGDLLGEFESELGVSPYSIEFVEAFVDLEAALNAGLPAGPDEDLPEPTMGIVLHGEFDEGKVLASLEEETGGEVTVEDYRGYPVFYGDTEQADGSAFSLLDSGTLLMGTVDGIKAIIDVAEGVDAPLSADDAQALDALGDRHLGIILSTPPEVMQMASEGTEGSGDGMAMLGMLDPTAMSSPLTVMSVSMSDSDMEIITRQFFEEEAEARAAKEYSEGTMAMMGVMLNFPEIQELAGGIAIDQNGTEVTTFLSIDEAQLEAIFGFLTGLMSLEPGETQN